MKEKHAKWDFSYARSKYLDETWKYKLGSSLSYACTLIYSEIEIKIDLSYLHFQQSNQKILDFQKIWDKGERVPNKSQLWAMESLWCTWRGNPSD